MGTRLRWSPVGHFPYLVSFFLFIGLTKAFFAPSQKWDRGRRKKLYSFDIYSIKNCPLKNGLKTVLWYRASTVRFSKFLVSFHIPLSIFYQIWIQGIWFMNVKLLFRKFSQANILALLLCHCSFNKIFLLLNISRHTSRCSWSFRKIVGLKWLCLRHFWK